MQLHATTVNKLFAKTTVWFLLWRYVGEPMICGWVHWHKGMCMWASS